MIPVLYLSNFIESKGYKDVLSLARMAKERDESRLHFHFAGKFFQDEDRNYFNSFVRQNDLAGYVTCHGIVSGQSKIDLLNRCSVFILLTRYPNEGQPISILEAMGNGMAIVTTDHAGIPDIVKNEINGLVLDRKNIDLNTVYAYITGFLNHPELLEQIGQTNYDTVKSSYTEAQYISNMDSVFRAILQCK